VAVFDSTEIALRFMMYRRLLNLGMSKLRKSVTVFLFTSYWLLTNDQHFLCLLPIVEVNC